MTYQTMAEEKTLIKGNIYLEHGEYNITIKHLTVDDVEQIVKALRGVVLLRAPHNTT